MTVAAAPRKQIFNGSGSTGPFTFNFRILNTTDIVVTHIDADGVQTVLTQPSGYSCELVNLGLSGGSITTTSAVESGETLVVEGATPLTQAAKYSNQGDFFPETHEASFDKLTLIAQELSDLLARALVIPAADETGTTVTLPLETARANKFLTFDDDGNVSVSTFTVNSTAELPWFTPTTSGPSLSDVALGVYKSAANVLGLAATSAAVLLLTNPADSVNYFKMQGDAANAGGGGITLGHLLLKGEGASEVITIDYMAKGHHAFGRGAHCFWSDDALLFRVSADGVAAGQTIDRHIAFEPGSTSAGKVPSMRSMKNDGYGGSNNNVTTDNIPLALLSCGNSPIYFMTRGGNTDTDPGGGAGTGGGTDVLQFAVADTPAAVNYLQVAGRATGSDPILSSQGTDTNVGILIQTKGTGAYGFFTGTVQGFGITHTASGVNHLRVTSSATGNAVSMFVNGSDTNVDITITPKGTGKLNTAGLNLTGANAPSNGIYLPTTNTLGLTANALDVLRLTISGSAVNYFTMTARATGSAPILAATGSDTNIGLSLQTKGTGAYSFLIGSVEQFGITDTASAVNRIRVTGSTTGNAPSIFINGSDTNVDLALAPKGTGVLRFGTHSAAGGETFTGFITIKDSGGTNRKLAVFS